MAKCKYCGIEVTTENAAASGRAIQVCSQCSAVAGTIRKIHKMPMIDIDRMIQKYTRLLYIYKSTSWNRRNGVPDPTTLIQSVVANDWKVHKIMQLVPKKVPWYRRIFG